MTRGYLTFVQNSGSVDYLTMAYAQALSIKATQKINSYSIVVDRTTEQLVTDQHRQVFDYIIPVPGEDDSANDKWKLKNEWKALQASPYIETIKVEADMLFTSSVDHWWDILALQDVCFTTNVVDYTGEISSSRVYRQVFDANHLLNVYSGFYYFKKSPLAEELFNYARLIYTNWPLFRDQLLKSVTEKEPNTDLVFAIAAKLCGDTKLHNPKTQIPRFVHMKGAINGWGINQDWQTMVYHQFDKTTLTVGFTRQTLPFHYHQKIFISNDIINHYEQLLRN